MKDEMKKRVKVTVAIQKEVLQEFDRIRDYIPRSAYLNRVLKDFIEYMNKKENERNIFEKNRGE